MFVNRQQELAYFNGILSQSRSGPAQLLLLYGRRRLGKTTLLRALCGLLAQDAGQVLWNGEDTRRLAEDGYDLFQVTGDAARIHAAKQSVAAKDKTFRWPLA